MKTSLTRPSSFFFAAAQAPEIARVDPVFRPPKRVSGTKHSAKATRLISWRDLSRGRPSRALGLGRAALVAFAALALVDCGNDDNDNGSSQVAAACNGACNATIGTCNLPAGTLQDCSTACQLGYTIAPACSSDYAAYTNCAKQQPLVSCSGNSVTVTASVPPCFDQLESYLTCAAGNISLCLELPLDDAACQNAKLSPHANACVGTQPTCQLLDGAMVQATGVGIYCCP